MLELFLVKLDHPDMSKARYAKTTELPVSGVAKNLPVQDAE
jgi:hypothetical protein